MRGRLGVLLTLLTLVGSGLLGVAPAGAAGRPLPSYLSLDPSVRQLLTVTSGRWSDTHAYLRAWRRGPGGGWLLAHGPVRVRLGYGGWVAARERRQSTGTTPAGRFTLRYAFGNRADPGTALRYRHVDADDVWPYEPRDPATYNIYQPAQAATSHWRADYAERLAGYGYEYAYAVVIGFNLPRGVSWSPARQQFVAAHPADTARGGGIFLHVQRQQHTAGCVAGPLDDIRWVVRWLDPQRSPRIVMGPKDWVKRRF